MDVTRPVEGFLQEPGVLVDVRSPAEHRQGHIPGAVNLPLFDDDERAQVGTVYKQEGRNAAVRLGLALTGPRLAGWGERLTQLAATGPLRVYCWRGGLRSGSVGWLAATLGLDHCLLAGGYKSFRQWVLAEVARPRRLMVLGGSTGCGKTEVLQALRRRDQPVVDLEALANHRGSSFGGLGLGAQPSGEAFENALAWSLREHSPSRAVWVEAESAQVGRCRIPAGFWALMKEAPLVLLERPLDERVAALTELYGVQAPALLLEATIRLERRLGPQRTVAATDHIRAGAMADACRIMLDYYDRTYAHELSRRPAPIARLEVAGMDADSVASQLVCLTTP
ncbi:MAG: tRNA 2-selenouridine(34) synthase MnmH [Cyanobacteriota bacterium]